MKKAPKKKPIKPPPGGGGTPLPPLETGIFVDDTGNAGWFDDNDVLSWTDDLGH